MGRGPSPRYLSTKGRVNCPDSSIRESQKKKITIFTDGRYAFGTVHIQGPIYRKRGFLTAKEKEIKNLPKIRRLLEAVQMPRAVSVVHVPGHQKGDSPTARRNRAADLAARKVADKDFITAVWAIGLPPPGMGTLPSTPECSSTDFAWI